MDILELTSDSSLMYEYYKNGCNVSIFCGIVAQYWIEFDSLWNSSAPDNVMAFGRVHSKHMLSYKSKLARDNFKLSSTFI